MTLNNCNSIIHLADVGNAHVILARHIDMESCAYSYRALIETVNMTSTARAHLVSLFYFFFCEKNSSISVIPFLTCSFTEPGTSIVFAEKKKHP